jgi:WD40 repeat protein
MWMRHKEGGVRSMIAVSPDGTRLAVRGGFANDRNVRLYDAVSGNPLRQLDRHAGAVLALALSSDGRLLATASAADGLQLWDAGTGGLLKDYACQVSSWSTGELVFSPDDRWLAIFVDSSQIGGGRIDVFHVDSGELEWEIQIKWDEPNGSRIPLAFAPDGKRLYTGGRRLEAWPLK